LISRESARIKRKRVDTINPGALFLHPSGFQRIGIGDRKIGIDVRIPRSARNSDVIFMVGEVSE